jgi:DNA topoisomerase IB
VRRGTGFAYLTADGHTVDAQTRERVKDLVIPPAWRDVWICPWPNGHIQAIGVDAAGRKQYLYHPDWRRSRDAEKHQRVLELARALPRARAQVTEHLALPEPTRERTLAAAFRMLDLGFFRIGSESYAEANGTFGLATMRREHVSVRGDSVRFEFLSKGSIQRQQRIVDPDLARVLRSLLRRRDLNPDLLAWREGRGRWHDLRSEDVNDYVREVTRGDHTAKDFRTWNATVLMAQALAVSTRADASPTARKRAVTRAVREVADYLGNTPTVARGSYIDARVIDLYLDGVTIDPLLVERGMDGNGLPVHGPVERAVLRLLA